MVFLWQKACIYKENSVKCKGCDMAYDEVGGCRRCGFFHGECPILETGRQSHAKKKNTIGLRMGNLCAFGLLCLMIGDLYLF